MSKYPNLIAFCGKKRSGKDFCLEALIEDQKGKSVVRRLSFSDGLKAVAHIIYPWLPENVPDELKDVPFIHPSNPRNMSPREIWLHLGNEYGLRFVQPDLFLSIFIRTYMEEVKNDLRDFPGCLHIISDVRTPQEYAWIKANQIKLIRISKEDRRGIVEDSIEAFIDEMEVDAEFINPFNGKNAFIEFYRKAIL